MGNISAKEALQLLLDGNERFTTGNPSVKDTSKAKFGELMKGQAPFAIIVTCSDSRVPPELIFDQGLGDLFVVRTAGNVVDQIAIESVEYAVKSLGTPLLVIMGHEKCGAVHDSVDSAESTGNTSVIASKIAPAAKRAVDSGLTGDQLYEKCGIENVQAVVDDLKESQIVKEFTGDGRLTVMGAYYRMGTGKVDFL